MARRPVLRRRAAGRAPSRRQQEPERSPHRPPRRGSLRHLSHHPCLFPVFAAIASGRRGHRVRSSGLGMRGLHGSENWRT